MAALKAPFGFKPSRNLHGVFNPATRRYPIETNAVGGVRPVVVVDPEKFSSGNNVRVVQIPATVANPLPLGVIMQGLDANQKPLVFSQPTKGPFLAAAAVGFVDVYTDTDNIYWVATDLTAPNTNVNACVLATALSSAGGNNAVGRSPFGVQLGTDTSATNERPWRIIGAAPQTRDYLMNADWVDGVEVILANAILT